MKIIKFEDYEIAGMAVMYTINHHFDITKIFPLIPVAWSRIGDPDHSDIISVKYGSYRRGCESISGGCMKNMIIIRMMFEESLISIKFNSNKIHICGTKDYKTPRYVCEVLLEHLDSLHDTICDIQENYSEYSSLIDDGPEDIEEFYDYISESRSPYRSFIENQLRDFMDDVYDISERSAWREQLLHLPSMIDVEELPDQFEIIDENTNMLNYNYDLSKIVGYPVRLLRLETLNVLMSINNCIVQADNRLKQNITLQIRSPDGYIHRMILNRNGKIVHSSHDQSSMSDIYYSLIPLLIEEGCIKNSDLHKSHRYDIRDVLGVSKDPIVM